MCRGSSRRVQGAEGAIEDGERSELSKNKEILMGNIHTYTIV